MARTTGAAISRKDECVQSEGGKDGEREARGNGRQSYWMDLETIKYFTRSKSVALFY